MAPTEGYACHRLAGRLIWAGCMAWGIGTQVRRPTVKCGLGYHVQTFGWKMDGEGPSGLLCLTCARQNCGPVHSKIMSIFGARVPASELVVTSTSSHGLIQWTCLAMHGLSKFGLRLGRKRRGRQCCVRTDCLEGGRFSIWVSLLFARTLS